MLTFRRAQALLVALVIIALYLFLTPSAVHGQSPETPIDATTGKAQSLIHNQDQASSQPSPDNPSANSVTPAAKEPVPQISLTDLAALPLRSQLAHQFPYTPASKFPAYIWQTWRVPPASGSFPEEWRPFEASWTELHPGFVHEVIDDSSAVHVLRHLYSGIPDVVSAYEALTRPVLRADFFRYLILLARGGIYSDIDTTALRPAFEWIPESVERSSYGLVIGIEADPDREDWADWYARRIQFCQWTIQSKPGHPILNEIVSRITEETLLRRRQGTLGKLLDGDDGVMDFTGPGIWTDIIFDFFNDAEYFDVAASKVDGGNITWREFANITQAKKVGDVVVLPITSFSPGVKQMGAGDVGDPMAFVHHMFEGKVPLPPPPPRTTDQRVPRQDHGNRATGETTPYDSDPRARPARVSKISDGSRVVPPRSTPRPKKLHEHWRYWENGAQGVDGAGGSVSGGDGYVYGEGVGYGQDDGYGKDGGFGEEVYGEGDVYGEGEGYGDEGGYADAAARGGVVVDGVTRRKG